MLGQTQAEPLGLETLEFNLWGSEPKLWGCFPGGTVPVPALAVITCFLGSFDTLFILQT